MPQEPKIPRVSVVVCAYQSGEGILPTLHSILSQSYGDFELIVIDDASGDDTPNIIRTLSDSRVRVIDNERNLGVVGSRNKGVALARGEYIAHCDHDDIWQPEKLSRQVTFLDENPDVGLVSTNIAKFDHGKRFSSGDQPLRTPKYLWWCLLLDSTFAHSAIMYRAGVFRKHNIQYNPDYTFADDWDIFLQMAKAATIACIPEPLTLYHLHDKNWTFRAGDKMTRNGQKVFYREINYWIDREVAKSDTDAYFLAYVSGAACGSTASLLTVGELLRELCDAFVEKTRPEPAEVEKIRESASRAWWLCVLKASNKLGPAMLRYYDAPQTPNWLQVGAAPRLKQRGKLYAKRILKLFQ